VWETCKMGTKFWLENPKRRDYEKDLGIYGKIILQWVIGKEGGKV